MLNTDNELERVLKLLDKMSEVSRIAMTSSSTFEDKLKFVRIQKTFIETRNKLIPLIFDYEDAKEITKDLPSFLGGAE